MPTYAYRCTACEHAFEVQQSFSDDALTVCPACEGRLRKVFSSVGVVFKGSGFYRNDARAGASKAASSARPGGSPTTSDAASTTSGTTPAAPAASSGSTSGTSSSGSSAASTSAPAASA